MNSSSCVVPKVGVYVDDPPSLVFRHLVAALEDMPVISRLRVMVDGPSPGFSDSRWSPGDLRKLRREVDSIRSNVDITLVYWASAKRDHIESIPSYLLPRISAAQADSIEADLEGAGGWKRSAVEGYSHLSQAGLALAEAVAPIRSSGIRTEASTFPGHVELTVNAGYSPFADRMNVQVYPIAWVSRRADGVRTRRIIKWSSRLGPRRRVRDGMESALANLPGSIRITAALPAWRQRWIDPEMPPEETMYASLTEWEWIRSDHPERVLPEISYWSWKWLVRAERILKSEGTYAREFLAALA